MWLVAWSLQNVSQPPWSSTIQCNDATTINAMRRNELLGAQKKNVAVIIKNIAPPPRFLARAFYNCPPVTLDLVVSLIAPNARGLAVSGMAALCTGLTYFKCWSSGLARGCTSCCIEVVLMESRATVVRPCRATTYSSSGLK